MNSCLRGNEQLLDLIPHFARGSIRHVMKSPYGYTGYTLDSTLESFYSSLLAIKKDENS